MTETQSTVLTACDFDTILPPPVTSAEFLGTLAKRLAYKFSEQFEQEAEGRECSFEELEDEDAPICIDFTVSAWRAIIANLRTIAAA
ncbi:hypothetical protein SAMN05216358_3223 [Rhizobium sp. AN5]|uniref:hypothetical protein n=1 Tax=Rhizobium sp. AN5 TaxID=1855304 RepID=UPI000BDB0AB7|nr:hypothetical protein [Rhizobium sp. AN5]SOC93059.1 hypothetical protein SAMN05216358_3223 [Rhizobium sp. AN5]